jgi:hypothetical protein
MIRLQWRTSMMGNEFKNEIFSSYDPNPVKACNYCDKKPTLLRSILNPKAGSTLRIFKCECGEQTWLDEKAYGSTQHGCNIKLRGLS